MALAPRMFMVSVRWVTTPLNPTLVDSAVEHMGEWLRFNGYLWLVYTSYTHDQIYDVLRQRLRQEDSLLILEVKPENARGWAPAWVWEWINKKVVGWQPAGSLPRSSAS